MNLITFLLMFMPNIFLAIILVSLDDSEQNKISKKEAFLGLGSLIGCVSSIVLSLILRQQVYIEDHHQESIAYILHFFMWFAIYLSGLSLIYLIKWYWKN